jgi:integrase
MFLKKHFNGVQTFRNYTQQKALAFLEELKKEDGTQYGQNTVTKIRFVAVEIFKEAIKRGYTDENPWLGIKVSDILTNAAEKGDAYTEAEVISLIRNLDAELGDTSKPLVEARDTNIRNAQIALAIGFWAGCRPSEIEALDWSNVDVTAGTIFVCESIVNGTHQNRTKTGSRDKDGSRLISYLSPLAPILTAWHKRAGSPTSGLVLQKDGKLVSLRRLGNEIIKPVAEKHGLRFSGIYGCRRGLGTHLVNIGVSVEYGAEMLGNTISIFESHYLIRTGNGSAKAAEIDPLHRLLQAKKAAEVNEERLLAAIGAGEGQ